MICAVAMMHFWVMSYHLGMQKTILFQFIKKNSGKNISTCQFFQLSFFKLVCVCVHMLLLKCSHLAFFQCSDSFIWEWRWWALTLSFANRCPFSVAFLKLCTKLCVWEDQPSALAYFMAVCFWPSHHTHKHGFHIFHAKIGLSLNYAFTSSWKNSWLEMIEVLD